MRYVVECTIDLEAENVNKASDLAWKLMFGVNDQDGDRGVRVHDVNVLTVLPQDDEGNG